jgi:hypothetical protein
MIITLMAALLSFVFAIKTICGTPLNLQDSDYELGACRRHCCCCLEASHNLFLQTDRAWLCT